MLVGGGCSNLSSTDSKSTSAAAEKEEAVIGDRILGAIRDKNYPEFHALIGQGAFAKEMAEKDFNTSCEQFKKQFGRIIQFSFLTELKTPGVKNLIWRVTFERPSANTGGDPIRQELLFRLVTAELEGKAEVIGMGFL